MTVKLSALGTRAIVLDIEGTTTPVEFVYEVLFAFARAHVSEYLGRAWDSEECRAAVARLKAEHAADGARGEGPPPPAESSPETERKSVASYVAWLMDRDRKSPGLKELQGWIWERGYRSGKLRGEVFDDVPPALERWRSAGLDVYIYSSGSVLAQQWLFKTTPAGDLTRFLRGYFDTGVGPKTSPESYSLIVSRIGLTPADVLFVTDMPAELDAAAEAGVRGVWCVRSRGDSGPDIIHTFDEILA